MTLTLKKAVQALNLATAYAEDGAVQTAITFAEKALLMLMMEKKRRIKIGLMPKEATNG